ncbi:MAG: hypothetical protein CMK59_08750 [Proteobacteria bacterium]|nr:hypothetical protein [Pseudomonadota bacterium]
MANADDYNHLRKMTVELFLTLSHFCEQLGVKGHAEHLKEEADLLNKDDLRVLFCGEFKRGKSTLVNAFLDDRILPMKIAPCTGVVTEVRFGEIPNATIYPINGEEYPIPFSELSKHLQIRDTPSADRVIIHFPSDFCRQGISLIDSPGLNEDWRRTEASLQEITRSDAVVMVLSCEMALSLSELDFIETQLGETTNGLFFVWNRYDSIWNNPEEIQALKERSDHYLAPYINRPKNPAQVHYLSAREGLVGAIKNDSDRKNNSGQPKFEQYLTEYLYQNRAPNKLLLPHRKLKKIIAYLKEVILPQYTQISQMKLQSLIRKQNTLTQSDIDQHRSTELSEATEEATEDLLNDLILLLDDFLAVISQRSFEASKDLRLPENAPRQERQDLILRFYRNWLRQELLRFAKQQLAPKIQEGYLELSNDLQLIQQRFYTHTSLTKSPQDSKDLAPSELLKLSIYDETWFKRLPTFISTAIAMLTLGSSSSPVAISLLGIGALRAWLTGTHLDEQDRRQLAEALSIGLRSQREEMIDLLRDHINPPCLRLQADLNRENKALYEDLRTLVETCISHKEKITEQLEAEDDTNEEITTFLEKKKKFHHRPPIQLQRMLEDYEQALERISNLLIKASASFTP